MCEENEVPFFFKQWGGVQKKKKGRLLNDRTYDEIPQINRSPIPTREERLEIARELQELGLKWAIQDNVIPLQNA
jgi:hypothetical protein